MRIAVAGGTGAIGRDVVRTVRGRGHDAVVLARSTGTDLYAGGGVDEQLAGVAVIDATSVQTVSARASIDFFRTMTQHLVTAGRRCGVRHHVTVSIIGAREAPFGYYAGKQPPEDLVLDQPNDTVVRAAQFHDFAHQVMARTRIGSRARVIEVPFPGTFGQAMRDGTLVVRAGTRLGGLAFDEWLAQQGR